MSTQHLRVSWPISNYEIKIAENLYLSNWPIKTTNEHNKILSNDPNKLLGLKLFNSNVSEHDLKILLEFINSKNFGIVDELFWLLPILPKGVQGSKACEIIGSYISTNIILNHLNTLEIKEIESFDSTCIIVKIGSNEFNKHMMNAYLYSSPGEHTTCDTFPILIQENDMNHMLNGLSNDTTSLNINNLSTLLVKKAKQPKLTICFSDNSTIDVLTIGLHGYCLAGETLIPAEKELMMTSYDPNNIVELNKLADKIIERTLDEETGLTCSGASVYLVDKHDKDGRDERYTVHQYGEIKFGYLRKSTSYVAIVVKNVIPNENYIPSDKDEIDSVEVIKLLNMIKQFGNEYQVAFQSHYLILHEIILKHITECVVRHIIKSSKFV
jgi:hypothetical protein